MVHTNDTREEIWKGWNQKKKQMNKMLQVGTGHYQYVSSPTNSERVCGGGREGPLASVLRDGTNLECHLMSAHGRRKMKLKMRPAARLI